MLDYIKMNLQLFAAGTLVNATTTYVNSDTGATTPFDGTRKEDLVKWAKNELAVTGYQVDRQNFGRIEFGEKRIDISFDYLNSPGEYAAILAVPRVLKRGIIVGQHASHKYRGFPTITFAAPVEINGVRGNMAVVVKQESKNVYKTHRILMPDGSAFEYKENAEPTPATLL